MLGGERVNSDGDERGAQLVPTDRSGEAQWSTVIQDDDEMQQYTAHTIADGYVYVLGAVDDGDNDATEKQEVVWKRSADDVDAPVGGGIGDSDRARVRRRGLQVRVIAGPFRFS